MKERGEWKKVHGIIQVVLASQVFIPMDNNFVGVKAVAYEFDLKSL